MQFYLEFLQEKASSTLDLHEYSLIDSHNLPA